MSAAPAEAPANEGVSDAESLYEFKVRLTEYGLAIRNGNGEKARVLAEVLASMLSTATTQPKPEAPAEGATFSAVECASGDGDCRFPNCKCPKKKATGSAS